MEILDLRKDYKLQGAISRKYIVADIDDMIFVNEPPKDTSFLFV